MAGPVLAADWIQTDNGSELRFEAMAQGERFEGQFNSFHTRFEFDPASPEKAKLEVKIDLGSVDTANAERDELLVSQDFFAVEQENQARFEAEQIHASAEGYTAGGTLTLKSTAKPVAFKFTFLVSADGQSAVLEGQTTLDRLDFGIGGGDWADEEMIGREVQVRTRVQLRRP
nr:YceI family protein [Pseudomarimonas arenosa]